MRTACLLAFIAALLFTGHQLAADPIQIVSINTSGDLVWVNTNLANGTYRVEFKGQLDGVWDTFPGLGQVVSDTSTTEVAMDLGDVEAQRFFRVLWLDPPLADSFVDFDGSQGNNGWHYGYALAATDQPTDENWFRHLPNYADGSWTINTNSYWTLISQQTMHPNGTLTTGGRQAVEQWAVLRWISTLDGPVRFDISLVDLNDSSGNGVIARLFQNGIERDTHAVANGGQATYSIHLNVALGQSIDFAIDPNQSDDAADVTEYRVLIYPE